MNTRLLIDAIVHQTTILIAELSTAAGLRAPLAHVADQVFLDLSKAIEAQGVSRKVAADMFGLAIRSYQKKVQRVTESTLTRTQTLWENVLDYLGERGSASRRELLKRYQREDPIVVASVLSDLVSNGLLYRTGTGDSSVFGVTQERDYERTIRERDRASLAPILWVLIYRANGMTRTKLAEKLTMDLETLDSALGELEAQGRIVRMGDGENAVFKAKHFVIPVDSELGWEAAVFDHYQAVVKAIGRKLQRGAPRSARDDINGGATLGFDLCEGHPHLEEALGLLKRVREESNALWSKVQAYNEEHPINDEERIDVSFYFGQSVVTPNE